MKRLSQIILFLLLVFLLYWRFQVAITRFFDVDEFTHLHWAAQVAQGQKMYVDFFTFFTPGFYWAFAPLFWIWYRDPTVFFAARILNFVFFLGIIAIVTGLFSRLRDRRYALLPAVILAFLPLPYDKFLEVRPDNLAALFVFLGLFLLPLALLREKKYTWFWSGVFYSLSLVVLVKEVPMVAIAVFVVGIRWFLRRDTSPVFFALGLAVPLLVFVLWALSLGNFPTVWYSLTKLAFEANGIGRYYIMEPHLFFFPNSSFYGGPGITGELLINHAVWILGLGVGLVRLFTPWITADGDRKKVLAELLLAGSFFAMVASYVQFFPLKHSQYLIPIAVFVSFYAADGIVVFLDWFARRAGEAVVPATILIFSFLVAATTLGVNKIKLGTSNRLQIEQMKKLIGLIPPRERVFDLEGRLMFWKNSYPICCLPMGSFLPLLSKPPPPIASVLETDKTRYIFQGDTGRLTFLQPDDLTYIKAHYEQVPGWGDSLWRRK